MNIFEKIKIKEMKIVLTEEKGENPGYIIDVNINNSSIYSQNQFLEDVDEIVPYLRGLFPNKKRLLGEIEEYIEDYKNSLYGFSVRAFNWFLEELLKDKKTCGFE